MVVLNIHEHTAGSVLEFPAVVWFIYLVLNKDNVFLLTVCIV